MTFQLIAPQPDFDNSLLLPDPILGNTEALDRTVDYKESMDGTVRTYVRDPNTKKFVFEFSNIGRGKLLEVQEFLRLFAGSTMMMLWTDQLSVGGRVVLDQESTSFTNVTLSVNAGGPRKESGNFTLAVIRL